MVTVLGGQVESRTERQGGCVNVAPSFLVV